MEKRYKIRFTSRGEKDLNTFRNRYRKSYIELLKNLPLLEIDPYKAGDSLKGKYKGFFSLHFSRKPECRAIYKIEENIVTVIIIRIDTRENIY